VEGSGNSNSPKEYSIVDACPFGKNPSSGNLQYRLKQIDNDGKFTYSEEVEIEINIIPGVFILEQNYPNPFNPTTIIKFGLPVTSYVTLEVYNTLGERVTQLINEIKDAGIYEIKWNLNTAGGLVSAVYIYTIYAKAENEHKIFRTSRKMMLLK
jgi:hypothetical protein